MKTILKLSLFASILILIAISCQKTLSYEDSLTANSGKEFNTEFVKNWYFNSFVKSAEYATNNIKKNGKKQPDWKNGTYRKVGNMEIMEFTLLKEKTEISVPSDNSFTSADKRKIAAASLKKISFIKTAGNKIEVRELDYVPEWEYLKKKNYDISDVKLGEPTNKFTGRIITKKWDGEILSIRRLNNGRVKGESVRNQAPSIINESVPHGPSESSNTACPAILVCIEGQWCNGYWQNDVWYPTGCSEWEETGDCWYEEDPNCEDEPPEPECDYGLSESCECQLYGTGCSGGGGGGEEENVSCATLTAALQNSEFIESTNTTGQSSVLSETADEIERSDFFEVGTHNIPIWATWQFFANNKIIIEKVANIKKFKNYTFGETTLFGSSIWYSCTANTLASSSKTISADKKTIDGHHWFHYKVSLLFEGCPVTQDFDRGTSFQRKIEDF